MSDLGVTIIIAFEITYVHTLLHCIHRCRIRSAWYELPRDHDYYRILDKWCSVREGEESEEAFIPYMCVRVHCMVTCSAKFDVTLQWNEIGSDGMFSPLPPALGADQNFWLTFSLRCMWIHVHFRHESLPMLRRCGRASREDALRPSAHPKTKGTDPEEIMIYLQAQSNWCWGRHGLDKG